jgi:glycosyltransferase involved in cell wall biosynthesis
MKSIAIISRDFPSERRPASASFVAHQARALSSFCQVKIISPEEYGDPRQLLKKAVGKPPDFVSALEVLRPRHIYVPKIESLRWAGFFRAAERAFKQLPNIDLLHGHFLYPGGLAAVRLARQAGIPSVVTAHGSDVNVYLKSPKLKKFVVECIESAGRIITVSDALRRQLIESGVPSDKIAVIPCGYSSEIFTLPKTPVEKSAESPTVLFAGNLVEIKGVEFLLRAFAELKKKIPGAKLVICGEGPLKSSLEQLSNELGISPATTFCVALSQAELAERMRSASVFCLPSLNEGLGLVNLEAIACGTPVVASNVGGIPEIVDDSVGALVAPKDVSGLASALEKVINTKYDVNILSRKAEPLSVQNCASRVFDVYKSLMQK